MQDRSRPPCVLIVDDERAYAEVLGDLLAEEGYSVVRAYDGLTAMNILSSERPLPDIILSDVMMPGGLSGDRLAAEVRRRFPDRRLPIILLSATADPRVRLRDVWFVPKPIDFSQLVPIVERARAEARAWPS